MYVESTLNHKCVDTHDMSLCSVMQLIIDTARFVSFLCKGVVGRRSSLPPVQSEEVLLDDIDPRVLADIEAGSKRTHKVVPQNSSV